MQLRRTEVDTSMPTARRGPSGIRSCLTFPLLHSIYLFLDQKAFLPSHSSVICCTKRTVVQQHTIRASAYVRALGQTNLCMYDREKRKSKVRVPICRFDRQSDSDAERKRWILLYWPVYSKLSGALSRTPDGCRGNPRLGASIAVHWYTVYRSRSSSFKMDGGRRFLAEPMQTAKALPRPLHHGCFIPRACFQQWKDATAITY